MELLPVLHNTILIDEMILIKLNKTDMRHCHILAVYVRRID